MEFLFLLLIAGGAGAMLLHRRKLLLRAERLLMESEASPEEPPRRQLPLQYAAYPAAALLALAAHRWASPSADTLSSAVFAFIAASAVHLYRGAAARREKSKREDDLVWNLPLAMERLVMAVQSGLDVIPAMKALHVLEKQTNADQVDPVMELLERVVAYAEGGLTFEEAIRRVNAETSCSAVKHAFTHLSLAYRDGGGLAQPLRELSDATQLAFQETVEERIAVLPVKATLPLLFTFAGLVICFITVPLIQILEITGKTMPVVQ